MTTVCRCEPNTAREKRVTIGIPLPNYKVYVCAPEDVTQLVPPGAVGELVIGGEGVAGLGYVGLPEKTDEVFVTDPFTEESSDAKMYRSGKWPTC